MKLTGKVVSADECLFHTQTERWARVPLGQWLIVHDVFWEDMLGLCDKCLEAANEMLHNTNESNMWPCWSCRLYRDKCSCSVNGGCARYKPLKAKVLLKHLHVLSGFAQDSNVPMAQEQTTVFGDHAEAVVGFGGRGVFGNFSRAYGHPHARITTGVQSVAVAGAYGVGHVDAFSLVAARHGGCVIAGRGDCADSAYRAVCATAGDTIEADVLYRENGKCLVKATQQDVLRLARLIDSLDEKREYS